MLSKVNQMQIFQCLRFPQRGGGGVNEEVLNRLLPISHVKENVSSKSKGQKMTPNPRIHFRFHLLLSLNVHPQMNLLMMP